MWVIKKKKAEYGVLSGSLRGNWSSEEPQNFVKEHRERQRTAV